jgi:hypothetical protein
MDAATQRWLVYGIVACAALLLLRGWLRRRKACEGCPIQEISRQGRSRREPSAPDSVGDASSGPPGAADHSKGDKE